MRLLLRTTRDCKAARGLSLVELMLAIGILGVGLICIAAVFPAGIRQTDEAVDDVMGPVVANNALSLIRSKVKPDMFGTREDARIILGLEPTELELREPATASGDWFWKRPALFDPVNAEDTVSLDTALPANSSLTHGAGAVRLFFDPASPLEGFDIDQDDLGVMPWNRQRNFNGVPDPVIFSQGERCYPMTDQISGTNAALGYYGEVNPDTFLPPRAGYMWDCMFRRHDGKILVAIFVYRIIDQGQGERVYWSQSNGTDVGIAHLDLEANDAALEATVRLPLSNVIDDQALPAYAQLREALEPGQWVIDQNNIVHRPLNAWTESDGERWCELRSPIPIGHLLDVNHYRDDDPVFGAVTDLWYLPLEVEVQDGQGSRFVDVVPVYATVQEL